LPELLGPTRTRTSLGEHLTAEPSLKMISDIDTAGEALAMF
jgi:hypothetical protein